jgi:chromosome segregation ATPase
MKPIIIQPRFIFKGFIIFLSILCCCILFDTCSRKSPSVKPQQTELKQATTLVKQIETHYQAALTTLKERNDKLQQELAQTKEELSSAKMKQSQSKLTVLRSARKDTTGKNPREQIADCDSLKAQVIAYIDIVDSTQCLYEKNIGELKQVIESKDEEVALCNTAYSELKAATEDNLKREQQLVDDLKKAYKKQKRKNFANKLLGVGVIVMTAVSGLLYANAVAR